MKNGKINKAKEKPAIVVSRERELNKQAKFASVLGIPCWGIKENGIGWHVYAHKDGASMLPPSFPGGFNRRTLNNTLWIIENAINTDANRNVIVDRYSEKYNSKLGYPAWWYNK